MSTHSVLRSSFSVRDFYQLPESECDLALLKGVIEGSSSVDEAAETLGIPGAALISKLSDFEGLLRKIHIDG